MAITETGSEALEDIWMAAQEITTFVASRNHAWIERIIDRAVPHSVYREHVSRYRYALADVVGRDVLDMACGTGYGADYIVREAGPRSVVGVDVEPDAIRYAKKRYRASAIEFLCADACDRWTNRTFDTILSFETIEHVSNPEQMLERVCAMLRADGVFYVSTPIRKSGELSDRPRNPHHVREWTEAEFRSLLSAYFDDVQLAGQNFTLLKKRGFLRIPGRFVRRLARSVPMDSPFFEALIFDVLPLDIVPLKYQAEPPGVMVARCQQRR